MQIHKILQYNFFDLSYILFYRIVYSCRLLVRNAYVSLFAPSYKALYADNCNQQYNDIAHKLSSYYDLLSHDEQAIISEAKYIISGKTNLFGLLHSFNPLSDWLKDLETGSFWPSNVYWTKARFVENGLADVKYVLEVNKLNDLVVLAQAYRISNDENYVKYIEKYLDGWISCVPFEKSVANKIAMDFGFRVINLIHISLLCANSDYYISHIHPKVLGIINHHVSHLWNNLSSRWFKSGNDNNHNIGEIVGLYVGQLWLREFGINVHLNKIDTELGYLANVTNKMIASSGCYMEQSSNYTRVVHDFFLVFELFRHSLDGNRPFACFDENNIFDKLSSYLLDISYHGKLPNFGDNDYARVVIPFENRNDVVAHVKKHYSKSITQGDYSLDGQWVYHSNDENEVFIFTRVGLFAKFVEGAFVHSHNDLLALDLFLKGQSIFIDKGTLFYNSGPEMRKEYTSTGAHNSIQVGKREMADFLPIGYCNYPKSSLIVSETRNNGCRFKGEVAYKDITHSREIIYNQSCITIMDYINKESGGIEQGVVHYCLSDELSVECNENIILLNNVLGKQVCSIVFEGINNLIVKETDYAPHYALIKKTKQIEGTFNIENKKQIKTIIELL